MTKKKREELEGFVMEPSSSRTGNGNRALPRVVPIARGEVLAVYPDDEAADAMRSEGWTKVKIGFKQPDFEELVLVKSEDNTGVNVRFYEHQRVSIHVTVRRHGTAKAKPGAGSCTVRRVGDAFVFSIRDQVSIEKPELVDAAEPESISEQQGRIAE